MQRSIRNISEIYAVVENLILGRYPSFVYGRKVCTNEIPTFCFHGVEYEPFEDMLQFLKSNKYINLTVEEYYEIYKSGNTDKLKNAILLTFDDGTGSLWSIAYPLLKKYGFKATAFIIPGMINSDKEYYPNLEVFWKQDKWIEEISNRDRSRQPLATWEEIEVMHKSGVIDFQSHTQTHSFTFTSPRIIGFVSPFTLSRFSDFQFSMFRNSNQKIVINNKPRLGAIIYESKPRAEGFLKYNDDLALQEKCITHVKENGEDLFFKERNWRKKLFRLVNDYKRKHVLKDSYETKDEQVESIKFELKRSKEMIEKHLPGKNVDHLCFPWGIGSKLATEISKEIGYMSTFADNMGNNLKLTINKDPYSISRLGPDFFYLLPGKGRTSLKEIVLKKIKKRIKRGTPHLSY